MRAYDVCITCRRSARGTCLEREGEGSWAAVEGGGARARSRGRAAPAPQGPPPGLVPCAAPQGPRRQRAALGDSLYGPPPAAGADGAGRTYD